MKPINEQINPRFIVQANKLTQYTQLLHNILPIECRSHVEVANIRQQILMLITDSPVWTTRLRQLSPQILQYIRENSSKFADNSNDNRGNKAQIIHHIQISTRYHTKNANEQRFESKKHWQKPQISNKTAELLSQSANSINDPELKTALLKIAGHGKTGSASSLNCKKSETEK